MVKMSIAEAAMAAEGPLWRSPEDRPQGPAPSGLLLPHPEGGAPREHGSAAAPVRVSRHQPPAGGTGFRAMGAFGAALSFGWPSGGLLWSRWLGWQD